MMILHLLPARVPACCPRHILTRLGVPGCVGLPGLGFPGSGRSFVSGGHMRLIHKR